MRKFFLGFIFLLAIVFLVYKHLFSPYFLSGGDWIYLFPEGIKGIVPFSTWDITYNGMGKSILPTLWVQSYSFTTIKIAYFISWLLYERIFWFFPIIILSLFSSFALTKYVTSDRFFSLFSSIIFLLNTYILLLVSGGQVGVAMGYAFTPLVILVFAKTLEANKIKNSILFALTLSLQVIFDIRFAYISLVAVFVYLLLTWFLQKRNILCGINLFLRNLFFPLCITALLHSFWILPILFSRLNPIEQFNSAYNTIEGVKFFSFATLENSMSLLHPNWPENIFGKVGFMKPEFLILPILAYSSLSFISKINNQKSKIYILYFAVLGLLGAFLAKGANEPFGGIYLWLFDNFPGFIMFRDPTKWYTLVAISYSILIPFSVWKIYDFLKSHSEFLIFNFKFSMKSKIFNFQNLFILLLISYLLFLIRPALFGQLSGTFKPGSIPLEYIELEKVLSSDNTFYRTFWIPSYQRFALYSNLHPAVSGNDFFKVNSSFDVIRQLKKQKNQELIKNASVKYIIVPYDSKGEIFLKDRKYDEKVYKKTVELLREVEWLKEVFRFGKIAVFEVPSPKDHFYISNQQSAINNQQISYKYVSPVEYRLEVKNAKIGEEIIFSESYDAGWQARDSNTKFYDWPNLIGSNPYDRRFNSFALRKSGNYSLIVYYYPQILVNIGMVISGLSLVLIIGALIYLRKKKI